MIRAAVLIGVEKTGNLPKLKAVRSGIEAMESWANAQPGMKDRVVKITDFDGGKVTPAMVQEAIEKLVEPGNLDQLIVYFAGHGTNVKRNEYWLLTDAPKNANAAVNVAGSVALAPHCGITHVVLFSDACRTAADSIQAQSVEGTIVFPNLGTEAKEGYVDVFYATRLGLPSLEVSDVQTATGSFEAVYTTALVKGLGGSHADIVERDGEPPVGRVRPWPLNDFLEVEVPKILIAKRVDPNVTQVPQSRINSRPEAWLAEVAAPDRARSPRRGSEAIRKAPPPTLDALSLRLIGQLIESGTLPPDALDELARVPGGAEIMKVARAIALPDGLGHNETECGFKIEGASVLRVVCAREPVNVLDPARTRVCVGEPPIRPEQTTHVLLEFDSGRGALLPAVPGFIAGIHFLDAELIDVTYEPSDQTAEWRELQPELPELRALRSTIASATRLGVFRLESEARAAELVERMRSFKGFDPALAVYAAYALHDLQQIGKIADIEGFLRHDLHIGLFDVAMLARRPGTRAARLPDDVFPAIPLLSQGWALLEPFGVELHPALSNLRRHVTDSLWTLLEPEGVALVSRAIERKELP